MTNMDAEVLAKAKQLFRSGRPYWQRRAVFAAEKFTGVLLGRISGHGIILLKRGDLVTSRQVLRGCSAAREANADAHYGIG